MYELGSMDVGSSVTRLSVTLSVGAADCGGAEDGKKVGAMPLGAQLIGSTVGKAVQEGALGTRVDGGNDGLTLGCEVGADVGGGVHI